MEKSKRIEEIEEKIVSEWKNKKDVKRLYEYINSLELSRSEKQELRDSDEYNMLAVAYHNFWG